MIQNQNLTVMKNKNQDCERKDKKNVKWLECTTVTLWFDEKKEPYFSTKSGIFGYFLADRNWKCHNNFLNEDEVRNYKNKDCEKKKQNICWKTQLRHCDLTRKKILFFEEIDIFCISLHFGYRKYSSWPEIEMHRLLWILNDTFPEWEYVPKRF